MRQRSTYVAVHLGQDKLNFLDTFGSKRTVRISTFGAGGARGRVMRIRRRLEGSGLAPDEIERLCQAYKEALQALHLVERGDDPLTEIIAEKIIAIGKDGGEPAEIAQRAIKALGLG